MSRPRSSVPNRWWSEGWALIVLKSPNSGSCSGSTLAKIAPNRLRASQPTQIQKSRPSLARLVGCSKSSSSSGSSLTADPRVDEVDGEVEEEVDEDHADRHHE